ncbi:hypothetical protein V8E36_003748 [Tilletia maclaganii]
MAVIKDASHAFVEEPVELEDYRVVLGAACMMYPRQNSLKASKHHSSTQPKGRVDVIVLYTCKGSKGDVAELKTAQRPLPLLSPAAELSFNGANDEGGKQTQNRPDMPAE